MEKKSHKLSQRLRFKPWNRCQVDVSLQKTKETLEASYCSTEGMPAMYWVQEAREKLKLII